MIDVFYVAYYDNLAVYQSTRVKVLKTDAF